MKNGLPTSNKYKVVVQCPTYNQSKYIKETLIGFSMQKTDFTFICCVYDDASTDGEQDVLMQWLEDYCDKEKVEIFNHPLAIVHIAPDKNNSNCIYAIHLHKVNLWGKSERHILRDYWINCGDYVAICEGDDYWIDPLKLQTQIDFLDNNPDYVLVHSDFVALNDSTGHKISNASSRYNIYNGEVFDNLFEECFIRTPTVCYRVVDFDLNIYDLPDNTFNGDLFLFYNLASKGKFQFFENETCVYRVLQESASHTTSEKKRKMIWQKYKNLDYFIANHFKVDRGIIHKLDYKWFKLDLRNCIATNDFKEINSLILPDYEISLFYKFLYHLCRFKVILSLLSALLRFKNRLGFNKWF